MHPVVNAGSSVTIAVAITGLIVYLVSLLPGHPVIPDNVVGYLDVLVTFGASYVIHANTQPAPAPAVPAAAPPAN